MKTRILVLVALSVTAGPLHGQSLFSAVGLGTPTEALDARTRALGSQGIGLWGSSLMPTDPAAASGLFATTGVLTAQPSWVDFSRSDGSESGAFQGARFPLVAVSYPAFGWGVATLSVGSVLDQRFTARRSAVVDVAGTPGEATDVFVQNGGVSVINLGFARGLPNGFSAGLSIGRYGGSVVRSLVRELDGVDVVGQPEAYQADGRWSYSGVLATAGVSKVLGTVARIAGSATWSSDLDASVDAASEGGSRSFSLPLEYRVGGSALLAPGLLVTASAARSGWSGTAGLGAAATVARAATRIGAGVELSRARLFGKDAPLRFGYAKRDLPFDQGGGAPTERVFAGGLGLALNQQGGLLLAGLDLSIERGERKDALLVERFWRGTLSLRVSGF